MYTSPSCSHCRHIAYHDLPSSLHTYYILVLSTNDSLPEFAGVAAGSCTTVRGAQVESLSLLLSLQPPTKRYKK